MNRHLRSVARFGARLLSYRRRLLGMALAALAAVLIATGRVLLVCGLLAQTLRARLGPQ